MDGLRPISADDAAAALALIGAVVDVEPCFDLTPAALAYLAAAPSGSAEEASADA